MLGLRAGVTDGTVYRPVNRGGQAQLVGLSEKLNSHRKRHRCIGPRRSNPQVENPAQPSRQTLEKASVTKPNSQNPCARVDPKNRGYSDIPGLSACRTSVKCSQPIEFTP